MLSRVSGDSRVGNEHASPTSKAEITLPFPTRRSLTAVLAICELIQQRLRSLPRWPPELRWVFEGYFSDTGGGFGAVAVVAVTDKWRSTRSNHRSAVVTLDNTLGSLVQVAEHDKFLTLKVRTEPKSSRPRRTSLPNRRDACPMVPYTRECLHGDARTGPSIMIEAATDNAVYSGGGDMIKIRTSRPSRNGDREGVVRWRRRLCNGNAALARLGDWSPVITNVFEEEPVVRAVNRFSAVMRRRAKRVMNA
ncbi:hypothetical protein EI94DRAFT_1708073 [Lactarius quietus]|nr:hypothetical protein EI94DRAFT_1708073 [Lactarius quietus]